MTIISMFEIAMASVFMSIAAGHIIRLVTALKHMRAIQKAEKLVRERSGNITGPVDPNFNMRPFQEAMRNASIMNQSGGERMVAQFDATMAHLNRLERETMITTASNLSSPHFSALAEAALQTEYQRTQSREQARNQAATVAHQELVNQHIANRENRMTLVDRTAQKEAYAKPPKKKEKPIEKPETRSAMQYIQLGDE